MRDYVQKIIYNLKMPLNDVSIFIHVHQAVLYLKASTINVKSYLIIKKLIRDML